MGYFRGFLVTAAQIGKRHRVTTQYSGGKYAGDESVSCPGGVDGLYQMRRDEFLPFSHHIDLGTPSTIGFQLSTMGSSTPKSRHD